MADRMNGKSFDSGVSVDVAPRKRLPRALWLLLVAGLALRVMAIIADTSLGILTQPDVALFHHQRALVLAQGWLDDRFFAPLSEFVPAGRNPDLRATLIAYLLVPFYLLFDTSSLVPGRLALAIYSLFLGPLTYALARELRLPERPALAAAGFVIFWPSIVYRSVVIQREVFVALATLAAVWVTLRLARSASLRPRSVIVEISVLVAAFALLFVFRPENLFVVAAMLTAALVVRYRERVRALVVTGAVALAAMAYAANNLGTFIGGKASLTPAAIDEFAHARAHGDSAYLTWLHYDSWLDIVIFAPLKLVYYIGSPMPWQVDSFGALLAGVSGWALLIATAFAVYGAIVALRHDGGPNARTAVNIDSRSGVVLITFLIVGIGAYSIIEMNAGAAFRRRIQFVPVILVFDVVALSALWRWISAKRNTSESLRPTQQTL
jgi:hypothetical protein